LTVVMRVVIWGKSFLHGESIIRNEKRNPNWLEWNWEIEMCCVCVIIIRCVFYFSWFLLLHTG
jgi:hypothetical protein